LNSFYKAICLNNLQLNQRVVSSNLLSDNQINANVNKFKLRRHNFGARQCSSRASENDKVRQIYWPIPREIKRIFIYICMWFNSTNNLIIAHAMHTAILWRLWLWFSFLIVFPLCNIPFSARMSAEFKRYIAAFTSGRR